MLFEILVHETAADELAKLRVHDQRKINDAIFEQLTHQPTTPTRNRKPLPGFAPMFEHAPPLWEIRVGAFRVFYDVNEETRHVNVRAIRRKDAGRRTEDIT